MLQANKAHVIAAFTRQNLNLRQLELQYWMEVLKKFATLASFLGGFASTVLQLQKGILGGPILFQLIFSITAAGALCLNFIVVVICTTCIIWGPGKALTGQGEESYKVVIGVMESAYNRSVVLFRLGTLCYLLGMVFASFCLFSLLGGILLTISISILLYYLINYINKLKNKFIPNTFNTGELRCNPIKNIAGLMTNHQDPTLSGHHLNLQFCSQI